MSPTRPPTYHERYLGGRKATDAAYNKARAHTPHEQALNSRRWRALRTLALQRDAYLCCECRAAGHHTPAVDVDHILPRHTHPDLTYTMDNLRSLCRSHHNVKTKAQR